jgi:hypothetical protein
MGPIFLGNGDESKAAAAHLHKRLDEALMELSGMQQPPRWDHEPTADDLQTETRNRAEAQKIIRSVLAELAVALGEPHVLLDSLDTLLAVPGRHNPAYRFKVRLELGFDPQAGWHLSRDDASGGGPFREGPRASSPSEAVLSFLKMVEEGKWSAPR